MISVAGASSWAEVVRRAATDLNHTQVIPSPPNSLLPQLPEDLDLDFAAELAAVDAADERPPSIIDEEVSEEFERPRKSSSASSLELPVVHGSPTAEPSKESAGSDDRRKRSIMKHVGPSQPVRLPKAPQHGVAHYQYGSHPRHVVPLYYPPPPNGQFVQGRRGGNHGNFANVRPPPSWNTYHRPPLCIGQGTGHMYPPSPGPYWATMNPPGMPYGPPPHHLPPATVFFPVPIPNDPLPSRIIKQIDYYFSESNLVKDMFLRSNMDSEGWVPISLIASFPRVKQLSKYIPFILTSLRSSRVVEVQGNKIRKRDNGRQWTLADSKVETN